MAAQDARDFYEKFYSPDRATIVVVGDVNENEVISKVESAYGSLQPKHTQDGEIKRDAEQTAQRRKKIALNIQSEKLWMAYKIPEASNPDTPVFEVIQGILSDGMNSRLNRALVNTGIATNASSGSFSLRDPGLFTVMADLQKGKTAALAESIILREIEQLKHKLVSDDELQRAKNLMRFHFYQKLGTANGKAHFLGEFETTYGNYEAGFTLQNDIMKVTPERIQQVVNQYFDTKKMTVLTGVPKK